MSNIRLLVYYVMRLRNRLLFLTGFPGVGKTTVLIKTTEVLRAGGRTVGGMISREIREHGERIGFEIVNLKSGRRGLLAHVDQCNGPRIGKYHVNVAELEDVGVSAISEAIESSDVIAIDEIGPMELSSEQFKNAVVSAIDCAKPVIGVIHWKAKGKPLEDYRSREDSLVYTITNRNRDELPAAITKEVERYLKQVQARE